LNQAFGGCSGNVPSSASRFCSDHIAPGARDDRDVDIALLAGRPLRAELRLELMQHLGEACGRPVDIVDLRTAGEPLLGEILKGRISLGDATAYAQMLSRYLNDSADFLPLQRRILTKRRQAWTRS